MLTTLAATLLTINASTVAVLPVQPAVTVAPAAKSAWTLSTALPTPGAWALMGMGGLALIRSRKTKR